MLERVAQELRELDFVPRIAEFSSKQAVIVDVPVEHGRYKGQTLVVGFSFQEDAYPEYPPHFVHLKSSVSTSKFTRHSEHDFEGEKWFAYSLPPSDFWDRLDSSQKNMKTYFRRHLLRVLDQL